MDGHVIGNQLRANRRGRTNQKRVNQKGKNPFVRENTFLITHYKSIATEIPIVKASTGRRYTLLSQVNGLKTDSKMDLFGGTAQRKWIMMFTCNALMICSLSG